jgi:hypothetical protein
MTEPKQYVKKPVAVWTMRWDGGVEAATSIIDWILDEGGTARYVGEGEDHFLRSMSPEDDAEFIVIDTLEGAHRMDVGDIAIQGVEGEFYPCKPKIFDRTYDAA